MRGVPWFTLATICRTAAGRWEERADPDRYYLAAVRGVISIRRSGGSTHEEDQAVKRSSACGLALALPLLAAANCVQAPEPKVREIATISGVEIAEAVRLPNGSVLLYTVNDSIVAYDVTTKRSTLVARGSVWNLAVSPSGDHIAYVEELEDGTTDVMWAMPIDPGTGTATGPARRVSTSQGYWPSFSPDGNRIAFVARGAGDSWNIAEVPAAGGTERVLATYHKPIRRVTWSDDGRWVFVEVGRPTGASISIERVPAAGGPSEALISYSPRAGTEGSIGGHIAFYRPDPDAEFEGRIGYVTASGTRDEFSIPPASKHRGVWSAQTLLTYATSPSVTHMLDLVDGTVRDLPGTLPSFEPAWSPDGRRLALFQESSGGHYQIVVVNADGSQPRRYPVTVDPRQATMHWSPSGEGLAYYPRARASLALLDTATGNTRPLFAAPDSPFIDFIWRPNGESIVLFKYLADSLGEVYEARLDGTQRKLRDAPTAFCCTKFLSDQLILGGESGLSNQYDAVPTSGGPAQRLAGRIGRRGFPGVSRDGRWFLFLLRENTDTSIKSVELITTGGDSSHTLRLPFEATHSGAPLFHADGRHAILRGRTQGDPSDKIFLVPLDGTTPSVLATLHSRRYRTIQQLSPDGRTLLFASQGVPTSTIYEVDLSPILGTARRP